MAETLDEKWYVVFDGQKQGPYNREAVLKLLAGGKITSQSLVWKNGMRDWTKLSETGEFETKAEEEEVPPPIPSEGASDSNELLDWRGIIEIKSQQVLTFKVERPGVLEITQSSEKGLVFMLFDSSATLLLSCDTEDYHNNLKKTVEVSKPGTYNVNIKNKWLIDRVFCAVKVTLT